ncbi:MAG: hypothetical protein B6I29_05615, partial [Marinitoga sp. 4572_148]
MKIQSLKNTIEKLSQSVYHESILTSFINNLDEVLGERFENSNKITQEIGTRVIDTIDKTSIISHELEEMYKNSQEEKGKISEINYKIINKLKDIGGNLDDVKYDVNES